MKISNNHKYVIINFNVDAPNLIRKIIIEKLNKVIEAAVIEECLLGLNDNIMRSLVLNMVRNILKETIEDGFEVVCDEVNNTPEIIDHHKLVCDIFLED